MRFYLEKSDGGLVRIGDLDDPRVAQEIGSGGAGRVLRPLARAFGGQLIKLYHTHPHDYAARHEHKVRAMLRSPPAGLRCSGKAVELAWPQAVVRDDNGKYRGFLMAGVGEFRLDQILHPSLRRKHRISDAMYFRLSLARSLAALVDNLHQAGYCVIDLKPENIRAYRSGTFGRDGVVGLIDTDGFAFNGPDGVPCAAGFATEDYLYPRIVDFERDVPRYSLEQDRWALAVIIFQLLNDNIHPLSGIDDPAFRQVHPAKVLERARFTPSLYAYGQTPHPHVRPAPGSIHEWFGPELCELVDRAFSNRLDPPAPGDWVLLLETLAHPRNRCPRDKHHWLYGERCGACALESRTTIKKRATARSPKQANAKTVGNRQRGAPTAPGGRGRSATMTPRAVRRIGPSIFPKTPLWHWLITGLVASAVVFSLSWIDLDPATPLVAHGSPPAVAKPPAPSPRASIARIGLPAGSTQQAGHPSAARAAYSPVSSPSHRPAPRVAVQRTPAAPPQTKPVPVQLTRAEVRDVQRLLERLGYSPGPADGIPGSKTQAAIRAFSEDRQLGPQKPPLELLLKLSAG